ncbi:ribosome small subunit-dependent GTPase A [Mycoplasma sp. P36-A1]|uniref:ribosome small subunit-dependent GTPase A n=1 Tax=Mycoplasma sp. P36-A1 TaxID=3252900 RepID=UPI003C2F0DA9
MEKNGIILKLTGGNYYVQVKDKILKCRARGKFRHQNIKPVVGDNVIIEILDHDQGYILEVLERKNILIRPAIANIDQALIVTSYKEPNFSTNLVDKFLAIIENYQIKPIIVVTKTDLAKSLESAKDDFKDYLNSGYEVYFTSIKDTKNLKELTDKMNNSISVLVGQSGAGKSSLLNSMDQQFNIKTNEISKALGRGKHTTRHVEIFQTKVGWIADSPGFSSLDLEMLTAIELAHSYHDFKEASQYCKFNNCLHENEPGCEVKERVKQNIIPQERYNNYLYFLNEIKNRKEKY